MTIDLTDLVDNPREALDIELKQWLDLNDGLVRANLARHIAALCNHGGGYIIFGFRDDASIDPNRPASLQGYNHDAINGIVKRYLVPTFDCQVVGVESSAREEYRIVRVPGHGVAPICAQRDGIQDSKGRPQGIRSGTYYIRAPGPESVAITSPQQWVSLIRRCTLNDRDTLLQQMTHVLQGGAVPTPTTADRLTTWDKAVAERFSEVLAAATGFQWPLPLSDAHYQLSYLITHEEQPKPIGEMRQLLEEMNSEVRNTVWTGWSMFYPFTRPEIAAVVCPENPDGSGMDLLETNLIGNGRFDTSMPDFWRVAPDGRASLVRGYREDVRLDKPGKWLSPMTVLRETAEVVSHARAFARRFPTATTVSFRCTWQGLRGREIRDFDPGVYWSPGKVAGAEKRVSTGEWPVTQLNADWPQVVADLGCPVLTLFRMGCSADLVRGMAPKFIAI